MFSIRPIVMAIALASVSPILLVPTTSAQAQDTVSVGAGMLVEILPVAQALGDGSTTIDVFVVAMGAKGNPLTGLRPKVEATTGDAAGWEEKGDGLYKFKFTPAKVGEVTDVTLSLTGKLPTKENIEAEYSFKVVPAPKAELEGSSNPGELVLGQTDEATLSLTGSAPKHGLLVRASAGDVTNLTDMGSGKHSARYKSPSVNFPHVAIVTMADEIDPLGIYGYTQLPLKGSVNYPVEATANASVMLRIGDREFGPVKAGDDGRATVPVVVPPGVQKATMVSVVDGESTEKQIDLKVPETKRMALFPLPKTVPADSALAVPVRMVLLKAGGEPDTEGKLVFKASEGTMSEATHKGDGVYESMFTPADSDSSATVTIEAFIEGSKIQRDSVEVAMVPRRATNVAWSVTPETPSPDTETVNIKGAGTGSNGEPIVGRLLSADLETGSLRGGAEEGEDGEFDLVVQLEAGAAKMDLLFGSTATDNAVAKVLVLPKLEHATNDGASETEVVIVTVDQFGYPVADATVTLALESGDGSVPEKITTNDKGIARIAYTSGTAVDLVSIRATAGHARGVGALIQAKADASAVDLRLSGSPAHRQLSRSWNDVTQSLTITPDASAPPPMPVVELAAADAEVTAIELEHYPAEVAPGGKVLLRAIPRTEDGKAVPQQELDVLVSAGEVTDVTETKGVYEATLTVPADAEGEAKVSVVAANDTMKRVKIPVNPEAAGTDGPTGAIWGPTSADEADEEDTSDAVADATPEEEPEEAEPEPEKEPKVKPEAGEHRWARAKVSGVMSVYTYSQNPSPNPGPILPRSLEVGGDSSPATPGGVELAARAYHPDIPYVGGQVSFRAANYSIDAAQFSQPANDWLYDVQANILGRYPFDVGADQYWVGAKAGFHYDDFMIFTGCLDPGCEVNFDPLALAGLGIGAELGAEIGDLFFVGGYTQGLAQASVPYSNTVDAEIGYEVIENGFVDLGFNWINRYVLLEGADSGEGRGEVADNQLVFKLGVGVAL